MPQYIQVGNDVVEFPDDMSDADIAAALSPKQEAKAPKTESPSFLDELARQVGLTGRAAISGITAPFAAAADVIPSLYNTGASLVGSGSRLPMASASQSKLLTRMGLPEPKPGLETAVQAGAEAIAGVGGQAKLAKQAGSAMLAPLTQNVGTQAAVGGTSAAVGQATSDKVLEATQDPTMAVIAGMALGSTAGALAGKGVNAATMSKTPPLTLDDIKSRAQRSYAKVDNLGVNIKPLSVHSMLDKAEDTLKQNNFNPLMDTHKPVNQLVAQLREMTGDRRVPFQKLEQMRSAATDLANSKEASTRKYAKIVVSSIDDLMANVTSKDAIGLTKDNAAKAVEAVKAARADWRNLARANALEDVLDTASLRAERPGASESELIRQGLINLANNKDKMRGFSAKEQAAIKSVIKGSFADPLLTLAAKFNPERNQMVMGGTLAYGMSNPVVAGSVAAGGYTADKLQSMMRERGTKRLVSQIASGQVPAQPTNYNWRALLESLPKQE